MTTPAQPAIYLALAAIMADIESIGKTRENTAQKFNFRGIEDVMNELHPVFRAHGVICVPRVTAVDHRDAGLTKEGSVKSRAVVTMAYQFVATDGSMVEAQMVGEGMDSSDKGTAKAVSMALKYVLLQTFLIATEDVVDADYYSPTVDAREELAVRARDKGAIQKIIDQHLADAAVAKNEEEKKHYLGLASELRCTLADFDVTPEPEKTPSTGQPEARTVEAEVIPPEKPKRTTAKPKPTASEPALPWQEVECHVGDANGIFLGHKLPEIFKPTRTRKAMETALKYIHDRVGILTNPNAKDAALWKAAQEAFSAWEAAQQPASTKWQDYLIESKNPDVAGKRLGDLDANGLAYIRDYLSKIDPERATLPQKTLKAMMALAAAEFSEKHGLIEPEHTHQLRTALIESNVKEPDFIAACREMGWIGTAQAVVEITENDAHTLLSDWPGVMDAVVNHGRKLL